MRQIAILVTLLLTTAHAGFFPKLLPGRSPSTSDFECYLSDSLPEEGPSTQKIGLVRLARRIGLGMASAILVDLVMESFAGRETVESPAIIEEEDDDFANTTFASEAECFEEQYDFDTHGAVDQAFIDACDGDVKQAEARWAATFAWRLVESVNSILQEPQPHFRAIKSHYPHFFHKRSRSGNLVYYERPGLSTLKHLLNSKELSMDNVVRHYIFFMEYANQVLNRGNPDGQFVSIWDLNGVGPGDLVGDMKHLMRRVLKLTQDHYPERTEVIFIVNAPRWFSAMWAAIKPFVATATVDKVRVLGGAALQGELFEYVAPENVPVAFGGSDRTPLGTAEEELSLAAAAEQVTPKDSRRRNSRKPRKTSADVEAQVQGKAKGLASAQARIRNQENSYVTMPF